MIMKNVVLKKRNLFITCILTHWTHYCLSYHSLLFYACHDALHFQVTVTCTDSLSTFSLPYFQKLPLVVINYLLMGYKLGIRGCLQFLTNIKIWKMIVKMYLGQVIVFCFPRAEYLWCSSVVASNLSIFYLDSESAWQRLSFFFLLAFQLCVTWSGKLWSWFDMLGIMSGQ